MGHLIEAGDFGSKGVGFGVGSSARIGGEIGVSLGVRLGVGISDSVASEVVLNLGGAVGPACGRWKRGGSLVLAI